MPSTVTRRAFVSSVVAAGSFAVIGCDTSSKRSAAGDGAANGAGPSMTSAVPAAAMTVYRDPGCGCCEKWAALARGAGYQVSLIDSADMPSIKRKYGVPDQLLSCHTAVVGDYAVEGHVPLEDVKSLLGRRPDGVKGLAVPGMPLGAPGMEAPDGTRQPFQVMAFDAAGKISAFTA